MFGESKLKPRPLLFHASLPDPFLPAGPLNALIDAPQLHGEPGPQLLQSGPDALHTPDRFPVGTHDVLLRRALFSEHVSVPTQEDVVALVVQRHYLPAFQLRLGRE